MVPWTVYPLPWVATLCRQAYFTHRCCCRCGDHDLCLMGCGASHRRGATYSTPACSEVTTKAPRHLQSRPESWAPQRSRGNLDGKVEEHPGSDCVVALSLTQSSLKATEAPRSTFSSTAASQVNVSHEETVAAPGATFSSADNLGATWAQPVVEDEVLAHEASLRTKAVAIAEAYNSFWGHIGLRKGWREAPFAYEEVQIPFFHAGYIVATVRAKLDEGRDGLIMRQLDGSAQNFLWGWPKDQSLASSQIFQDFVRGLVFATLSDGHGLVEGLDSATVESYVCSYLEHCPGPAEAQRTEPSLASLSPEASAHAERVHLASQRDEGLVLESPSEKDAVLLSRDLDA